MFASYFVEQFANYENFIIMPQQSYEQWQANREQFQNFDKTAFISDQPANCREFFSAFVETSMFTGFIDDKIVTFWDPEKASHKLTLFEAHVESYREKSGLAKPPTPGIRIPSEWNCSKFGSCVHVCMYVELSLWEALSTKNSVHTFCVKLHIGVCIIEVLCVL